MFNCYVPAHCQESIRAMVRASGAFENVHPDSRICARIEDGDLLICVAPPGGVLSESAMPCRQFPEFDPKRSSAETYPLATEVYQDDRGIFRVAAPWESDSSSEMGLGTGVMYSTFPLSAPCCRETIRCISAGSDPRPGAYRLQHIDAVLKSGEILYPDRSGRLGNPFYDHWFLTPLQDERMVTHHIAGPDEYGVPRVFEIQIDRVGRERHTVPPSRRQISDPPLYAVHVDSDRYTLEKLRYQSA